MCKLIFYIQDMSMICSVLNLTAMSMERFYAIVYPLQSRRVCTVSQARRVVLSTWIVALVLALPRTFIQVILRFLLIIIWIHGHLGPVWSWKQDRWFFLLVYSKLGGSLPLAGVPAVYAGHCTGAAILGHGGDILNYFSRGSQGHQKKRCFRRNPYHSWKVKSNLQTILALFCLTQ